MLVDRKHIPWAVGTLVAGGAASAWYVSDAPRHLNGPSGSTLVGFTLGSVALAIMLFCTALSLKRKVPHWRTGKASTWLRGHIWLGLLTCLLVGLHAAFRLGGPMTMLLWALLTLVTISGLLGLLIQQFVPRLLLHSVPGETIAQQLQRRLNDLPGLAERVVVQYAGGLDTAAPPWDDGGEIPAKPPAGGEPIRRFYLDHLSGHLAGQAGGDLDDAHRAENLFSALHTMTPAHAHAGIAELSSIYHLHRDLCRQRRLMRVLFAWLIVHVPLSWALLVLVMAHAFTALRFWT